MNCIIKETILQRDHFRGSQNGSIISKSVLKGDVLLRDCTLNSRKMNIYALTLHKCVKSCIKITMHTV